MGNGGSEAPSIENIEVLTTNSEIGDTAFTYKDSIISTTAITGVSSGSPTIRTIQAKVDDHVSVRDYGALGDGATDDTSAINRALADLYVTNTFQASRRALLFPAGTYIVQTSELKIPAYSTLLGEGTNASIIKRATTTITNVVQTSDSKNQIGANIGTSGAIVPTDISIINMGFWNSTDNDVFLVDQVDGIYFDNCLFLGNKTTLASSTGNDKACLRLTSAGTKTVKNARFNSCIFKNNTYGVQIDDEVYGVVFSNCRFENLYKGIVIGQNAGANPPAGVKVMGSFFNIIYAQGIHAYAGKVSSVSNHYKEVGNSGAGAGSPAAAVIQFVVAGSYSMGDTFSRSDADDLTFKRIDTNGVASFAMDQKGYKYGTFKRDGGGSVTLSDNTSATTGITMDDTSEKYTEIEYSITRGALVRNGIARITHDSSNQTLSEEYDENSTTVGVTFTITNASGTTTLNYTTTSTGVDAAMKYSIRKLV